MYLYSVHDTTLISLFSVFDIKLEKWPPFAAYLTLELYENKVCLIFLKFCQPRRYLNLVSSIMLPPVVTSSVECTCFERYFLQFQDGEHFVRMLYCGKVLFPRYLKIITLFIIQQCSNVSCVFQVVQFKKYNKELLPFSQ